MKNHFEYFPVFTTYMIVQSFQDDLIFRYGLPKSGFPVEMVMYFLFILFYRSQSF